MIKYTRWECRRALICKCDPKLIGESQRKKKRFKIHSTTRLGVRRFASFANMIGYPVNNGFMKEWEKK